MDKFVGWLRAHRDYCMSLIRIYLGIGLFVKGLQFAFAQDDLRALLIEHDVVMAGAALIHFIILAHLAGGFLMAIGAATRAGALIQIPPVLGATMFVRSGYEFTALVLFLLVMFVWHGSGPLSFDETVLYRKRAAAH